MKSKFFIDRPILSIALAVMMAIVGIVGYFNLPVEQFPDMAPPIVEVSADYPGASAEAVQKSVIIPIEEAINGANGIDYISSSSMSSGSASIQVVFKNGIDPDMAVVMVKNKVTEVEGVLPQEVLKTGVHVETSEQTFLKVIALECPDNRFESDFISNFFDINIKPRLQRIQGVGKVNVLGNTFAMRIWLDPKRMAQYDLLPEDIEEVLEAQNIEAAIGTLGENSKHTFQYTLVYRGRLLNEEEFGNIVIKSLPRGAELRLRDVARCELGSENYTNNSWINGHNGTVAFITQKAGSNAQQVNLKIDELMEQVRPQLPPGVEFKVLLDSNDFLNASMAEVYKTLVEAILLVVLVVLLFLQNRRATLIPAFAIIVSLLSTFAFMYLVGFSLNLITLFALVLVIGTVVDDAIVVVEAVQSEFEKGVRSPYQATLNAMGNIGTAVVTTTVVFMCVFIPASFSGGLSGTFYKEFGLTMAAAVAFSTLNALTLSPALCALLLRDEGGSTPAYATPSRGAQAFGHRLGKAFNASVAVLTEKYQKGLSMFVPHKWLAVSLVAAPLVLLVWLQKITPTSLVPYEDTGITMVDITTPPGSTLEQTKKTVHKVAEAVKDIEEVETSASIVGWNILGGDGANMGMMIMKLKPWDERSGSEHRIDNVLEKIEERVSTIKTGSMFAYALPTVTGYGFSDGIELYVQDYEGGSIDKLKEVTDRFAKALDEREEIGEVYSSYEVNFPQFTVSVNATICKRYGIEPSAVLKILNGYIGGDYATQFNAFGKLYHVILQADPELRADRDDLNNILIHTDRGAYIPITELTTFKRTYGVESLGRFNLFSSIGIEISPEEGYSSGDVIQAIAEVASQSLPQGYGYDFTGTTREEISSTANMTWIFLLVMVFVYLVLCSLYESMLIPLAVLLSVPFGIAGSFAVVYLIGLENNIYMQVGVIMLIGLLAKTAILLTEYASARRREGMSIRDAALEAAQVRLRPILMTAMTLIIGLLPLVFATGAGAVSNISLGVCVIAGMTIGTLALLFFVPVFFIIFQHLEEKYMPKRKIQKSVIPLLVSLLVLTSCGTYSNYHRQGAIMNDSIIRSDLSQTDSFAPSYSQGWREVFKEPRLAALIEEGLARNSDLNIAKLHVDAAKASLRNAKGELFPSLKLETNGETFRLKSLDTDAMTSSEANFRAEASWEVDIFGKLQNAKKAAAANVEEKAAYVQAVQVELIATIATSYYQLEMYDAQISDTRDIVNSWDESVRAQKALMAVGEATSDEVSMAEASKLEAEETLEALQLQMIEAENALCLLLGRYSGHIDRGDFLTSCEQMPQIPHVNIQVLATRPDIRQAEAALKKAFYLTNEARAALYPSLNLSGMIGWTNSVGDATTPTSLIMRALGSLTQPVFANGKLRAEVKKAQAEQEEAKIAFRQAILKAGQEVNNVLATRQYTQRAIQQISQQVEKLMDVLNATEKRMRYDSEVNYLQVLLSRQALLEARLSLLSHRYGYIDSTIQLYKVLGGAL